MALPRVSPGEEQSTVPEPVERGEGRVTARSVLIAIVLTVACGVWVRQAEIVVLSTQITESVPPIPAIAVLMALVLLNPLLRRAAARLALTRAEMLTIYCFIAIAITMLGVGVARFWLSLITAPFYFATASNDFASLWPAFPNWLVVKDPKAIHDLYVRSPTGAVPWRLWLVPMAAWTAFFLALWVCMLCMMLLVRRRWIHEERLTFPIVELPLEITAASGRQSAPAFLRDPWMWGGFALAAVYNVINMLQGMFPGMPAPGKLLDLSPMLENSNFKVLQPLELWYRPELIGFGFLVPSEILFSMWFFFVVSKAEALLASAYAFDIPGAPFEQQQSIGAFLLLGVWSLWQVRADIARSLRSLWRPAERVEGIPRWALPGLVGSFVFLCWFCIAAGMKPWVPVAYLAIVLLTALVVARIRAAAGVPLIWLFPFYQQKKILLYTLGVAPFLGGKIPTTLVIFAMLTVLARGYFPSAIGYQIESLKIAEEARIGRRQICAVMVLACLVGLVVAYYYHLDPYYRYGAQNLRGGIWGTWLSIPEYTDVVNAPTAPALPDLYRTGASIFGALLAAALLLLRSAFVSFPLHPVGYAVATAFGGTVWWSFFLTWIAKTAILRWGGMPLYRRAVPAFLGFALGHFFVAGAVWGLIGAWWQEGAQAYPVWFG